MPDLVQASSDLQTYSLSRLVISPERWKAFACSTPLQWQIVKFDRSEVNRVPGDKGGVYTFVVKPGVADHPECSYLMYVGKAERQSLRKRFAQYFKEKGSPRARPKVWKMLNFWENYLWFCYAQVDDQTMIDELERKLIDAYVPPINDEFPGELGKAMQAWI